MPPLRATQSLRIRYIIGLLAIGLLVTASYLTMQRVVSEQRNFAKLINLAGHQSGLANRVAYFASMMASTNDDAEYSVAKSQVGRTINKMERAHRVLLEGSEELGIPHLTNENLHLIYEDPMVGLDLAVQRYLERARTVYDKSMDELSVGSVSYVFLTTYGPHVLEAMFDAAVEEYEKIGREAILRIENFEMAIWIAALAALLLEALFIFRPLERRIGNALASLEETVAELTTTRERLLAERNRAQQYLDIVGVILVALDREGRVTLINDKGCRVLELEEEKVVGAVWFERFLPPEDISKVRAFFKRLMAGDVESVENVENRIVTERGEIRLMAWHNTIIRDISGRIVGTLSSGEDVTERRRVEKALYKERSFLQHIIDGVEDPILVIGDDHGVLRANRSAKSMADEKGVEVAELPCFVFLERSGNTRVFAGPHSSLREVMRTATPRKLVHKSELAVGEMRTFEISVSPLLDDEGTVVGTIQASRDISEHLKLLEELKASQNSYAHLAHHDALTGLPNRLLFTDRLEQPIRTAHRTKRKLAVLFVDLDGFKSVNDSFDHSFGDEVLKGVAVRLQALIREDDTIARMGGDEFTVVLSGIRHAQDAGLVAQKILDLFKEPFEIRKHTVFLGASIGVSVYPKHGKYVDDLVRNADTAMYRAKEEGRNTFQYYSESMTAKAFERILLETNLRKALEAEQLVLHYQPQLASQRPD
jgi:diguanylate cyclase (GGDEF)-like protein/PAS domain S-box-containing protein